MRASLGKNTETEKGKMDGNLHDTDVAVPHCRTVDMSKFQGRTRARHGATYYRLLECLVSLQFLILAGRLRFCEASRAKRIHHRPISIAAFGDWMCILVWRWYNRCLKSDRS